MKRNRKFQGGHGKFHRKSRGSTSKKSMSSTGGLQFFSGKAQCLLIMARTFANNKELGKYYLVTRNEIKGPNLFEINRGFVTYFLLILF